MRTVRVKLAYDGSRFFGWQRQEGFHSVQEAVEDALVSLTGESVTVHGAGRTDTGVHAFGQVAHFHLASGLEDEQLLRALNAHLEPGVVALALETCREPFHAQYDARGKRYVYVVATTRFRPPSGGETFHWVHDPLDLEAMRAAAARLVGEHDFSAFSNAGSPRRSNVRTVRSVHLWARRRRLAIAVEGSGFLYNMVRTIAGTLLDAGRGKLTADDVSAVLAARDRKRAGPTAPACGLYLLSVQYATPCFRGEWGGPRPAGVFRPSE